MAGPGGGPPRRSHTKSRKGCETCKRRHIRCDESFPQCHNCTKHKQRCPYNDMRTPDSDRSASPLKKPSLVSNARLQGALAHWQATGEFPFPNLGVYPAPMPHTHTQQNLRLIYHVANVCHQLHSNVDANGMTLWTPHIPALLRIGVDHEYVEHAVLAFSAMHLASLTESSAFHKLADEHRGAAFGGLQAALGSFSRETSDPILAASLVISWQAADWRSWTQLMQGTSSVITAMDAWKHESQFPDFIAESSTFPTAPPSPDPNHRPSQLRPDDLEACQRTLDQLQRVEQHLKRNKEDVKPVQRLASFLKGIRKNAPGLSISAQYTHLRPLRDWLFWLPVQYLQQPNCSASSYVVIAHLYSVALLMGRLFPDVGAAYFGSLSISPIEHVAFRLRSMSLECPGQQTPLALMEFPLEAIYEFRSRMGRFYPPGEQPFYPHSSLPNLAMADEPRAPITAEPPQHYAPYGHMPYDYSSEEMPTLNTGPASAHSHASVSPLMLSSPFPDPQFLHVPSLSGTYSPASTLDGSVAYSDPDECKYVLAAYPSGPPSLLAEAPCDYSVVNPPRESVPPDHLQPSDVASAFCVGVSTAFDEPLGIAGMGHAGPIPRHVPRHRHTASASSCWSPSPFTTCIESSGEIGPV